MGRKPTGTVWRDKGKWRVQLTLGGRRWSSVVPERTGGRPVTKAWAEDFRDRLVDRYVSGVWDPWAPPEARPARDQTVTDYVKAWLGKQDYSTKHDDERRVKRYLRASPLGKMPLCDVRPRHVADFLDHLRRLPSARGGKIAGRTIRNIYSVVQRAFARATVDEVFEVSPCDAVARAGLIPDLTDKQPGARPSWKYSRPEVSALLYDPRLPTDRRTLYGILFLTGCRFGEAAALRWSDYDAEAVPLGRITIARSVQPETRVVKSTKTGVVKYAPVHPALAEILAEWRGAGWKAMFGREPKPEDTLVPNRLGQPRAPSASFQALGRDCARLGIPPRGMKLHGMRHTFITHARADGAVGEVLKWVTHAPPKSMIDQYTDMDWVRLCAEVAKLRVERIARESARGVDGE